MPRRPILFGQLRVGIVWVGVVAVAMGAALEAQEAPPAVRSLEDGRRELATFLQAEGARLGQLAKLAGRVELATHRSAGLAMAFYDPGSQEGAPRIVVREEFYLDDHDRLFSAEEMAVDVYEYLLHSVILAWFHLDLLPDGSVSSSVSAAVSVDPDYRRFVESRAEEQMPETQVETREAQYVTGLASFGSHVLSLYNEIARARLRGDGGDGLCRLLAQEGGLFGLWRHDLQRASYSGYALDDGPPLERVDQARFLEVVLARDWTGDPDHDLSAEVCALSEVAPRR